MASAAVWNLDTGLCEWGQDGPCSNCRLNAIALSKNKGNGSGDGRF